VVVPKGLKQRRLHKAFLRYHDPDNWPLLREALNKMGRADLIGNGSKHLVPRFQPKGTGDAPEGGRRPFRTQHARSEAGDTESAPVAGRSRARSRSGRKSRSGERSHRAKSRSGERSHRAQNRQR